MRLTPKQVHDMKMIVKHSGCYRSRCGGCPIAPQQDYPAHIYNFCQTSAAVQLATIALKKHVDIIFEEQILKGETHDTKNA